MLPLHLLDDLTPHARVATAVLPFVVAMVLRILLGRARVLNLLISLSTVWFVVNILLAPYSWRMQEDLQGIRRILP